ncbi:MAG: PAS domain S-box protein, partial [Candidatus Dormiibacterota bacterium]
MVLRASRKLSARPAHPLSTSESRVKPGPTVNDPAEPPAARTSTAAPEAHSIPPTLNLSEQELVRAAVTASPTALTVIGPDRKVLLWNPAAERLFGWTAAEVVGGELPIIHESKRAEFALYYGTSLRGQDMSGVEVQRLHRDGHTVDAALTTVALHDSSGKVVAALGAYHDITAQKAAEAELVRQARMDDLTGLVNRNGLLEHLRLLQPSRRRQVSVIAIDLDHFKQVNDAFGHPAG